MAVAVQNAGERETGWMVTGSSGYNRLLAGGLGGAFGGVHIGRGYVGLLRMLRESTGSDPLF